MLGGLNWFLTALLDQGTSHFRSRDLFGGGDTVSAFIQPHTAALSNLRRDLGEKQVVQETRLHRSSFFSFWEMWQWWQWRPASSGFTPYCRIHVNSLFIARTFFCFSPIFFGVLLTLALLCVHEGNWSGRNILEYDGRLAWRLARAILEILKHCSLKPGWPGCHANTCSIWAIRRSNKRWIKRGAS